MPTYEYVRTAEYVRSTSVIHYFYCGPPSTYVLQMIRLWNALVEIQTEILTRY